MIFFSCPSALFWTFDRLVPGSGRFPGGGHGNLLQYFCLENPMDRGAWRATVQSRKEADISEDLACKLVKSDLLHLKLESGFAI